MNKNLNGLFEVTVDEKGRFSFPAKLYSQLAEDKIVYITRGGHKQCLWLVPQKYWEQFTARISSNSSPFDEEGLSLVRYFIGHAFELEIDERTRRLSIPAALAEIANIKDKCSVVGMMKFLELWNPDVFRDKMKQDDMAREKRASELGGLVKF